MPVIEIKNVVLGGLADTKYLGIANSVARAVGIDLHSEPGIIKVNQKLTKESGSTVTEFCKFAVNCSNGEVYLFSADSGKVWRRNSSGVYSLCHTTVPAAGEAKCLGAAEYQGYIIWATQSRLHRISTAAALSEASWASHTHNWQTFSNTDLEYHPFVEQNLVLYIGDANYLASWNGSAFVANALDIKTPLRISALGKHLTDVLLGTYIASNVQDTEILRWNTWSPSFSSFDNIPEDGVYGFLATDNMVVAVAGQKGNLYAYDGANFQQYKRIPGNWTKTNAAKMFNDASINLYGLPIFGISDISGSPCDCGLFSYGAYSREYPKVLNLEYPISQGKVASVSIGAVALYGNTILVAWKEGSNYGVDKLDTSNKIGALTVDGSAVAGAFFESRVIDIERETGKDFTVKIGYRNIPTGTSIQIWQKTNNGSWTQVTDTVNDTDDKMFYGKTRIVDANTIQFRVVLVSSADNAPEVDSANIEY